MNKEAQMSVQEIVRYREQLMRQKEFLTDILSKVEKQILALQVERLHLRNTLLGTDHPGRKTVSAALAKNSCEKTDSTTDNPKHLPEQELDLSLSFLNTSEEEESDNEELTMNDELLDKNHFVKDIS